ncbi:MAG TPA: hypothetical protein VFJ02_03245 [Vicinamibacterales bacterium]|nr:hypothetical protein [Vicinamibacterales bacterium]
MRPTWVRPLVGVAVTAICALALAIVAGAQAPDPIVGTWKMDVAKSTYKPGPPPKSATVVITAEGKSIKVAVDAEMPSGPMKWGYTSARDGKDVPVTGNPNYDTANATQTNPHEGTIVYKKDGKTVATTKTSVAKDGKTLTVTSDGTDAKGQAFHNVSHYTKQ